MKEKVLRAVMQKQTDNLKELFKLIEKYPAMIKNRINGKELKICNECMGKFQFEQETEGTGNGK